MGTSTRYQDTGQYDEQSEAQVRANIVLWALYAEAGPGYDPSGDYLCGTCRMRAGEDTCVRVGRPGEGPISFTMGTCRIYQIGEPAEAAPMPKKLSKEETGYTERPHEKGFGCRRCEYGAEAIAPDSAGRPSWCSRWGLHVLPNSCCDQNEGPDDIVPVIGRSLQESIIRQRITRNIDRAQARLSPAQRAAVIESEVMKVMAEEMEPEQEILDEAQQDILEPIAHPRRTRNTGLKP